MIYLFFLYRFKTFVSKTYTVLEYPAVATSCRRLRNLKRSAKAEENNRLFTSKIASLWNLQCIYEHKLTSLHFGLV